MIVQVQPQVDGGCDTFHLVSAGSTNAINIKSTGGQVFGWYIYNSNTSARKINFYDIPGNPIVGTTTIRFALVIPPGSGANVFFDIGVIFKNGIAISTTTGLADNDSAAVTLNDLIINIFYK